MNDPTYEFAFALAQYRSAVIRRQYLPDGEPDTDPALKAADDAAADDIEEGLVRLAKTPCSGPEQLLQKAMVLAEIVAEDMNDIVWAALAASIVADTRSAALQAANRDAKDGTDFVTNYIAERDAKARAA